VLKPGVAARVVEGQRTACCACCAAVGLGVAVQVLAKQHTACCACQAKRGAMMKA